MALAPVKAWAYRSGIVTQAQNSPRSWRDIARELASEPDQSKRRALMSELGQSFDPPVATCAICNKLCDLTTCKIDEDGYPVHELCYTMRMKNAERGSS